MEKDLTLVVLAAGMGSRYGGLKQLDQLGPSGETIMDYSIFDAMRAGFNRIVFVIRRDFEEEFKRVVGARYAGHVRVEYAFQKLDDLPGNFTVPEGRQKPWGTGHAVYAARHLLTTPFAVINADDFYGADSYRQLAGYLSAPKAAPGRIRGCIAAFILRNTLSENGSVSRGICSSCDGNLVNVVEHTKIFRRDGRIVSAQEDGSEVFFTGEEPVSMNSWGFMPEIVGELESRFEEFLRLRGKEMKSEFYLPALVDSLIKADKAEIAMRQSADNWFGVTYREDRPLVQAALKQLVDTGKYPRSLF
ncbi:MAG: NTP transferase domain-containing protein [Victivallaceae bacterium]|nr:NTP transferase domain-containing protein [Victivallaceae bacterium]